MRFLLSSLFLFVLCSSGFSQKVLQMEKYGKPKTQKFYIGQSLTFQIKGDDFWITERIEDILVEENSVLFTNRIVNIDNIHKIKTYRNRGWSRALSFSLMTFSGGFVGLSLIVWATTSWSPTTITWMLPAIALPLSLLTRWIFKSKTHKLGKKRKLRLLDLTPVPYQQP